jgi:hypothetical protein
MSEVAMSELDHHPESESRYSCSHCQETGIDIESREYCTECELGKRRMNLDRLAEPLRLHPFTNAMWVAHHSAMKAERAIAAADLALLKSKLLQAERELAEVRKDAERYRYLRDFGDENKPAVMIQGRWYGAKLGNGVGFDLDAAIDAASTAQEAKGE